VDNVAAAPAETPQAPWMHSLARTGWIAVRDTLVALLISVAAAAPFFIVALWRLRGSDPDTRSPGWVLATVGWPLWISMVSGAVALGFVGRWFRDRREVEGWELPPPLRLSATPAAALGVAVGFGGLMLSGVVAALTAALLGIERPADEMLVELAGVGGGVLAAFAFLFVVVAPISEELFFRGHLHRWSASRCGVPCGYALSATLFALIHFNPLGIPLILTFGVVLAWSYQRWRTLVVPIVAHATFNAIVVAGVVARVSRGA